jgi:hypothetical protein
VGALTGLSASLLLKLKIQFRNAIVAGILGSAGFFFGWFTVFLIPWRNTITYYADKTLVTSAFFGPRFQHIPRLLNIRAKNAFLFLTPWDAAQP